MGELAVSFCLNEVAEDCFWVKREPFVSDSFLIYSEARARLILRRHILVKRVQLFPKSEKV